MVGAWLAGLVVALPLRLLLGRLLLLLLLLLLLFMPDYPVQVVKHLRVRCLEAEELLDFDL